MNRLAGLAFLLCAVFLCGLPVAAGAATSRVYVVAFPCANADAGPVVAPGAPVIHLYDQAFYGDSGVQVGFLPTITVTKQTDDEIDFYFDVKPGDYDVFIKFPTRDVKGVCGRNGPLVVLPRKDRHLFIAAMSGVTDWHAPAAVAGTLPMRGIRVSVLVYEHPMRCGDDIRTFDPKTYKFVIAPHEGSAVIDDGAYYANIHAYGRQDHTVAIQFSGALFTSGAVLLTATPDVDPHKPSFIIKNVTTAILHAATARPFDRKLICVDGF